MTQTQSIEQKWSQEGPDWSDPTEVLAYSDWLEEQGMEAPAAGARWLLAEEKKPDIWRNKRGWFIGDSDWPHRTWKLPQGFLPPSSEYSEWHDEDTTDRAYMAVVNELKLHPEKVNLLKGTP